MQKRPRSLAHSDSWRCCCALRMAGHRCRLQIRLPGLDRHLDGRIGGLAPEFAPVEDHSVEPVRVLTLAVRDCVRKHVASADAFDDAGMSAGIARQAGMAGRIDVAGAHAVAWRKFRRCRRRPVETAATKGFRCVRGGQHALDWFGRMEGAAGRELFISYESELYAQIFEAEGAFLVVAAAEIDMRRQRLAREPAD